MCVPAVVGGQTFGDLSLDKAGTGYTLTAASTGLSAPTSAAFNISAATANKLVFTLQPSNVVAGAAITPAVQVTTQDNLGNTVTSFSGNVTVALGNNPGGGALSGTTTVAAVSGVATFPGLGVNKAANGYTLTAVATGLTTASSTAFNVTPGTASQLVFTVEPTTTTAAAAITPSVQVTAQDPQGNTATAFTGNVTVALGANPGGGTLPATTTVAAAGGHATFAGLSITRPGTGLTLAAATNGIATKLSTAFNVAAGTATQLVFSVQPSAVTAGAAITPAVQVTAEDALGNSDPTFTGNVTVALGANPGGGALSGTTTVTAVGGGAAPAKPPRQKSGKGFTPPAAGPRPPTQPSAAFHVTPGAGGPPRFQRGPSQAHPG